MADILIRGVRMPIKDFHITLTIMGTGEVFWFDEKVGTAVPLPEGHGRLVDTREVLEKADKAPWFDGDVSELGLLLGSEVTTIVPAEGGGEDG